MITRSTVPRRSGVPWPGVAALVATSAFLAFAGALGQEPQPQITGVVTGEGFTPIAIAVPDAQADPGVSAEGAELTSTVRDDLEFSGFFDVIDPALYALVRPTASGTVAHDEWRAIGANILAACRVVKRGDRLDVEARVYDNPSRVQVLAKRYGGGADLLRRIAHQIADDIVLHFTGRPGIAMSRIVFTSKHGVGKDLYVMDYDGRRIRRLTTSGVLNLGPVWSPDGNRLAFVSWRERQPAVFIMEGSGQIVRAPTAGGELNSAPSWSPDGLKLAYASTAAGNAEIYLADLSSKRVTRLTFNPGIDTSPAISPNSREIAFTSDRSGSPQIYIMDTDGLNVRRVTSEGKYNESAAWSPRGDRLAYVSRLDGRFDIVVLTLATGELRRLTHGEGSNEDPRWAPDGRHLVFSSTRDGPSQIYTMRSDGTEVRKLTRGEPSFTPDWSR